MGDDDDKSNYLRFSDTLAFYAEEGDGYLASEGFADERVVLYHNEGGAEDFKTTKFSDCVFEMLPTHEYHAMKTLKKYRKRKAAKAKMKGEKPDANTGHDFTEHRLEEQWNQEVEANSAMVEELSGQAVCYGQVIQLRHVKSQKYVMMLPKIVAEQERGCSAVVLDVKGGTGCFFEVQSRYKFRENGARVLKTDEIYLVNPKVDQYLHMAAEAMPMQLKMREVNASQALKTRWKIVSFSAHDPNSGNFLNGGDVIYLHHPESDTSFSRGGRLQNGMLDVVLTGNSNGDQLEKVSSNGMFEIEREDFEKGGPAEFVLSGTPCNFRFRHMASGLYLMVEKIDEDDKSANEAAFSLELPHPLPELEEGAVMPQRRQVTHKLVIGGEQRHKNTLFELEATGFSGSNQISSKATVCLKNHSHQLFVHSPADPFKDLVASCNDKIEGPVISWPFLGRDSLAEHTLMLTPVPEQDLKNLHMVLGTIPVLSAYCNRMEKIRNTKQTAATLAEEAGNSEGKSGIDLSTVTNIKVAMRKTLKHSQTKPTAASIEISDSPLNGLEATMILKTMSTLIFFVTATDSTDPATCEGLPICEHQKLLREQGFADMLARMLEVPFQGGDCAPYDLAEIEKGHPIIDISQLVYRLLHHMAKGYTPNEYVIAAHTDLFIKQACLTGDDNDLYAEATLTTVLSNNEWLLQSNVNQASLKLFVDLLLEQDKDKRYVDLLAATCSCKGEAINSNQEDLIQLIFGSESTVNSLTIRTALDQKGGPNIKFIDFEDGDLSPLATFLEDDQEMVDYYISMISLFAELCLDRNYVAIYYIEALYAYEVVLSCMANRQLPYSLRAAMSKLFYTLHVDREPQLLIPVPSYTRTNTNNTPELGYVPGQSPHDFKDVKAFVNKYFKEICGVACAWEREKNQMTVNVLAVAYFVVAAGFMTTSRDITRLVSALVDNLDGTNDITYHPDEGRLDPGNKARYELSEGTVLIMDAKISMCKTLLLISDLRLDSRITDVLRCYGGLSEGEEISSDSFNSIFNAQDLDLQAASKKDMVAILMDLCMYKNPKLVNVAFSNLVRHFSQKHDLLEACSRVQLLQDPREVLLYESVQRDLRRLSALVETDELWLGVPDSEGRADETKEILATLLTYCGAGDNTPKKLTATTSPADQAVHEQQEERRRQSISSSRPATAEVAAMLDPKSARELLRNLDAHGAIIKVLKIDNLLNVMPVGEELMQVAYHFLQAFGGSSKANREELAEHNELFMEHLTHDNHKVVTAAAETLQITADEFDIELIKACFEGRGEPMQQVFEVPDPEAEEGDEEAKIALDQPCHNLACLDLLKQSLIVDNKYSRKNQNTVMKVAMDPQRLGKAPVQHKWLCERSFDVLADHGFTEEAGVAAADVLRDPSNSSLLELLIKCCQGGNGLMQAKCQGIFSLPLLAEHVEALGKEFSAKRQLLDYMRMVYLEAAHGIDHELAHNTMFKIFTTDIELSLDDGVLDDEENEYIFEVLLPCISVYFTNFAEVLKANDDQMMMAVAILSNIADLFETSENEKYQLQCSTLAKKMMESRQFFTSIVQDGEWQPRCHRYERLVSFEPEVSATEEVAEEEEQEVVEEEEQASPGKKAPPSAFELAMKSLQEDEQSIILAELEFEMLCQSIKDVSILSTNQFTETVITFEEVLGKQLELINDLDLSTDLGRAGIKVLRKMIEMENDASTLPASEWENEDWEDAHDSVVEWQDKMGAMGAFQLVIHLVGQHPDTDVVMDAIDLGVTLLLGGNKISQDSFFEMSGQDGSLEFFRRLDSLLEQSRDEMRDVNAAVVVEEDPDEEPDEEEDDGFDENKNAQIVFRFMQLMCEGHNKPCQGRMQAQPNTTSYDLVARTQQILQLLAVDMACDLDEDRMEAACQALDTLTEVVQGPCPIAQTSLIENKMLDTAVYIMASGYPSLDIPEGEDCHPLVMDLKEKTVTLLLSLLEGVTDKSVVEQFAEVLDLEVLRLRMCDVYGMCVEDPAVVADSRKIPEDVYWGDMTEAFSIYMLMSKLAKHSEEARMAIMPSSYKDVQEQQAALMFFQGNTGCIEIDWETMDCLEEVHFPIPPIAWYLTEESRDNLLVKVNRDSPEEKLRDWYTAWTDELMSEMEHLSYMSQFRVVQFISENLGELKSAQYLLALAINMCMLACMQATQQTLPTDETADLIANIEFSASIVETITTVLGYCLLALATFIGLGVAVTQGPLAVQNSWNRMVVEQGRPTETEVCPEYNTWEMLLRWGPQPAGIYDDEAEAGTKVIYLVMSAYYLLCDSAVLWHLICIICAVLGCVISPFFFACHLLDVVYRSETLLNVLRAVTIPGEQLLMTAALAVIILYIYSVLGFLLVRDSFMSDDFPDERRCDKLADCFTTTIREGLINGGGMADTFIPKPVSHKAEFIKRFFFDLTYFVIVIIILLNVIFGIIIDTFASMREADDERKADMLNTCFICSIDKNTFDRGGTPFAQHIKQEHNMWEYLYYVVYLRQKDDTEYSGIETYVADKLDEDDTSFYPTEKALCLGNEEEEEDPWKTEVNDRFDKLTSEFAMLKRTCLDIREESSANVATSMDLGKETISVIDKIKVAYNPPSYDETQSWFSQTRAAEEKAKAEATAKLAAERAELAEQALARAEEQVKEKSAAEALLLEKQAQLEAEIAGAPPTAGEDAPPPPPPAPTDAWSPTEPASAEGAEGEGASSEAAPILIEPDEEDGETCPECGASGMFKFCTECGHRNPNS